MEREGEKVVEEVESGEEGRGEEGEKKGKRRREMSLVSVLFNRYTQ